MSEFSDSLALAFPSSLDVFGDEITIAETAYRAVFHALDGSQTVRKDTAGRSLDRTGSVYLSFADWDDAKLRLANLGLNIRGARVTTPWGVFRIINDPDIGFTKDTVELKLGPLS